MDPINPWLDPGETRRMAEQLRGPARQPITSPDEAGFDDSFVGFSGMDAGPAEEPPPQAESAASAKVPDPARVLEPVSEPTPAPAVPDAPAVASCPNFGWLCEGFGATGHFIFREDGELVCDDGKYGAYHFLARDLARTRGAGQHVRVRILADAVLEILPVETQGGLSWLGIVVPEPLSPESLRQIHLRWFADEREL